jgi:hypothetical protein
MNTHFIYSETTVSSVVVDANLSRQLQSLNQPIHLCDPSGRVIGTFTPSEEWDVTGPDVSDDEILQQLQRKEPTFTTAEVLAHLGRLP